MITTERRKEQIKDDTAKQGFVSRSWLDLGWMQYSLGSFEIKPKRFIVCYLSFPFSRGNQLLLTL